MPLFHCIRRIIQLMNDIDLCSPFTLESNKFKFVCRVADSRLFLDQMYFLKLSYYFDSVPKAIEFEFNYIKFCDTHHKIYIFIETCHQILMWR